MTALSASCWKTLLSPVAVAAGIIATVFAHGAKAQNGTIQPDVVRDAMVRDIRADSVLTLQRTTTQSPDRATIRPYSIMVTGDGQMGPDIELRAPDNMPDIAPKE